MLITTLISAFRFASGDCKTELILGNEISNTSAMLSSVLKKKLSDEKIANIFVNSILDITDKGFSDVAAMIADDPSFVTPPKISALSEGHFTMIVIVGNLKFIENHFGVLHVGAIEELIYEKLAVVFDTTVEEFKKWKKEYEALMNRVNHPSKNTLYAMSKALFHKYHLNEYQDDYFKRMQSPNPLFIKRLDEIMENFIWDWTAFFKKYRLSA